MSDTRSLDTALDTLLGRPGGARRARDSAVRVALASAYPEREEERPSTLDRVGDFVFDHFAWPLWRRLWPTRRLLARVVPRAAAHEAALRAADDAALHARIAPLRARLRREGFALAPTAELLALVREVARRHLGQRPYDVQLIAACALLQGRLAEMATGEGKSLTAALAAAAAALAGLPVHLVTVNDYLAERDAQALAPLYDALGLSVGRVVHGQSSAERQAAYGCDVAYCSNKEFAFDYLRDRVALASGGGRLPMAVAALAGAHSAPLLLRGLHFVLVDEADSVFVDEARTPLILSAMQGADDLALEAARCVTALALAAELVPDLHYRNVQVGRRVVLSIAGETLLTELTPSVAAQHAGPAGVDAVWASARGRREMVQQALSARLHYLRDQQYLVSEDKVVIIDESTGRTMADRSWEAGLHQMIETKEGLTPSPRRLTLARITYQRLFRRCLRLAGMTGTGREVAGELWQVYRLPTVAIPLHRPSARRVLPPRLLPDAAAKWQAVAARAHEVALGAQRPVLIGTRSVEASEQLSLSLHAAGVPHALLNARQDGEEAAVIARAGEAARVTVATNMAGRGTDIALADGVAARGGLHVILTECHSSARVDRQLFGRGARQGDAGSAEMILAADDELLRTHAAVLLGLLPGRWRHGHAPRWAILALVRAAQARAGWRDAAQRRATLRLDERLDRVLAFTGNPE